MKQTTAPTQEERRVREHAEVAAVHRMAEMARRMAKLEEAVPAAKVAKLDRWLKVHHLDAVRGDGSAQYTDWQKGD